MNEQQIIESYDEIVQHDSNYGVMLDKIASRMKGKVLEVGAGTGLLTRRLVQQDLDEVIAIEPSELFVAKFRENLPQQPIVQADAIIYRHSEHVDTIAMSLVYHHIEDERKEAFLRNMFRNLKDRGRIVIGDVFLLPYDNEKGRDESLKTFHGARVAKISNPFIREVEEQTLEDGLARDGEYKTSEEVLRLLLVKVGFKKIETIEIGNQESGGYKIVIAEK